MPFDESAIEQETLNQRENQVRFFFNVITGRWKLIFAFVVGTTAGFALWVWLWPVMSPPPEFEAQTQLIARQSPYDREVFRGLGGTPLLTNTPRVLVERINRQEVAEDVARALIRAGINESTLSGRLTTEQEYHTKASQIAAGLSFVAEPNSNIVLIKGRSSDAVEARRIVDYAARSFIRRNNDFVIVEQKDAFEFIENNLKEVESLLDEAENKVWEFRQLMDYQTYEDIELRMQRLNEELRESRNSQDECRARIEDIQRELQENNERFPQALDQISDNVIQGLLRDLDELLQQKFDMEVVYTPDYPPLRELEDRIMVKQEAIAIAVQQLDAGMEAGKDVWHRRQSLLEQHLKAQLDLTSQKVRAQTIEKQLNEYVESWPELKERRKEYQQLSRIADSYREQYNTILESRRRLEEAARRGTGPVERFTAASMAVRLTPPRKTRGLFNILVGAGVGLVAGIALALLLEMMDDSIRTAEDVSQYIGLEVIGMIPRMRFEEDGKSQRKRRGNVVSIQKDSVVDACVITRNDPKSPISESYRTLRTNFQFATIQNKPRTIMVTSAVPAEGKTTTAVNMAVTFADCGYRVLVIDTDMRRPHVHHVLKGKREPGLADLLRGNSTINEVIQPTPIKNLFVMPSGHVPPNPSELIGSERMQKTMDSLGEQFDLVICDAPSVLVVTDPVLLATRVDTVVLVVSTFYARRETVRRAKKLMDTARANIAGVVVNGLDATRRHYYYYYYYYDDNASRRRKAWINIFQ